MKLRKNFWVYIVCILLVLGIAIGEELTPSLNILAILESEDVLKAVVYTTIDGNLQPGDFDAKLDGQSIQIAEVSSMNRSELGSTYLFVLDMPNTRNDFDKIKALAQSLIKQAGPNDNIGIMSIDSVSSKVSLVSSQEEAANTIEEIAFTRSANATFNTTIMEALEYLRTNGQTKARMCLIVLSACEQKTKTLGATDSEIENSVKQGDASIYCITLLSAKETSKEQINRANYLNSLARLSKGGIPLNATGKNDDQISTAFSQNEKRFFVLSIAPDQLHKNWGSKLSLSMRDHEHTLSDSMEIGDDVRNAFAKLPQSTSETADEDIVIDDGHGKFFDSLTTEVLLFCGAGVILLVLIIILIAMMMKNKKKHAQRNAFDIPAPDNTANDYGVGKTEVDDQPRIRITLTGIGESAGKNFKMDVRDGILIGRDNEEARVRLDHDKKLSRRHALITYASGVLRIEDLNSQNGTRINQEPDKIVSSRVLNQNDTFRAGHSEFRVNWTVE